MSQLIRFVLRLFNLLRGSRADEQLSRELDAHLPLMQDDFERRGMSPDEARRAARRAFGGVEQAKEQQRDARSFVWLEDATRDLAYAVRMLVRSPGFTLTAVSRRRRRRLRSRAFCSLDRLADIRRHCRPAHHDRRRRGVLARAPGGANGSDDRVASGVTGETSRLHHD